MSFTRHSTTCNSTRSVVQVATPAPKKSPSSVQTILACCIISSVKGSSFEGARLDGQGDPGSRIRQGPHRVTGGGSPAHGSLCTQTIEMELLRATDLLPVVVHNLDGLRPFRHPRRTPLVRQIVNFETLSVSTAMLPN